MHLNSFRGNLDVCRVHQIICESAEETKGISREWPKIIYYLYVCIKTCKGVDSPLVLPKHVQVNFMDGFDELIMRQGVPAGVTSETRNTVNIGQNSEALMLSKTCTNPVNSQIYPLTAVWCISLLLC